MKHGINVHYYMAQLKCGHPYHHRQVKDSTSCTSKPSSAALDIPAQPGCHCCPRNSMQGGAPSLYPFESLVPAYKSLKFTRPCPSHMGVRENKSLAFASPTW